MAVVQNTYPDNIGEAINGQIASTVNSQVDTLICDEATGIPFGRVVSEAPGAAGTLGEAKLGLGAAAGYQVRGLSLLERSIPPRDVNTDGDPIYVQGKHVGVMFEGEMWVEVQAAVVAGNDVTYDADTGELSTKAVAAQVDSPGDATYKPAQIAVGLNSRWMTSQATVKGLAKVRLGTNLSTS